MAIDQEARDRRARAAGHDTWSAWVASVATETGYPVCGEPTVKRPVRPCSRPESWGVAGESEGPCTDHQEAAEVKRQATKKRYLELVASGDYTLQGSARVAGVDRKTLDRWAETDPTFAKERRQAEVSRARRRVENLGDILYREALEGKTRGNERIFLLKVYAASLRRRGVDPPLDYDQPDRIELSAGEGVESAREALERKLEDVRERIAFHDGEEEAASDEQPQSNGQGAGSADPDRGGGGPPS